MKKRVLVTGAAGFIGFHLSRKLLDTGYRVCGVDNINSYYDSALKTNRVKLLETSDNFNFMKLNIAKTVELRQLFEEFKPQKVVNLAAQAGVRYSIEHPEVYLESNLSGFLNILECCRHSNVEGLIYASSSSVYGKNKIPFSISDITDTPISLYAATKKANELMAHAYSHLFGLHTTGLRFFTVYGPFGRPDMAIQIFAKSISEGKPIQVFNHGNMRRDFTYIDDIIRGTISAIENNYECEVFNLGNHESVELLHLIALLEEKIGKKAILEMKPMQPGDVQESYADIEYSIEKLKYHPQVGIDEGISNFVKWYKKYYGN